MNELKLSKRLEMVANLIPEGSTLADIGSDHAYLPIHCYLKGIVPFAIAGEVVEGPFKTAKNQVNRLDLHTWIDVRKGDGLDVITTGEVNAITICGMGGALIASILESGKEKLAGVNRLILQPNISAVSVRRWLLHNGWKLIEEKILEEDDKIYEILVAEPGDSTQPYTSPNQTKELLLGPFLLREHSSVFVKKWMLEKENWERILSQLEGAAPSTEVEEKKVELTTYIQFVKEELN
ncbi:tRNA (adenine22-N1)-methyltransferase [Bacillus mesophilus]|uniref:tRNA (Adenine-N(1))-methyltransferase n=1 Tax=Bacillus mesophilus TaxID=1808955 RepID=A0A6M0Q5U5_9BACI|nr:tRNA (adenine22-N1)-methyltransferase [Bacillus mesophilus]NEY71644.1 tRNA (adenine-N(1))-methyltransferase [Bacillus mesophilus]